MTKTEYNEMIAKSGIVMDEPEKLMKKTGNPSPNKWAPNALTDDELTIAEARLLLPDNMRHLELSMTEYKFLAVYCSSFNGEDAIKKAGFNVNKKQARALAYSLLNKKEIIDGIKIYIDTVMKPYRDRLEFELLMTYYKRATYKIDIFYDKHGKPLTMDKIDPEWLCCIDDIKYVKMDKDYVISAYQLPNRDNALQALYKFVTGQDIQNTVLPEDAKARIDRIYQTVVNGDVNIKKVGRKPKVRNITPLPSQD